MIEPCFVSIAGLAVRQGMALSTILFGARFCRLAAIRSGPLNFILRFAGRSASRPSEPIGIQMRPW